jgi:hypothetical protein
MAQTTSFDLSVVSILISSALALTSIFTIASLVNHIKSRDVRKFPKLGNYKTLSNFRDVIAEGYSKVCE